jgi:hypothetical protein
MEDHSFGNLMDWGRVLERLEKIKENSALDEYQNELIRILRYKENWRLTERVLEYAREIRHPVDELIGELCSILRNPTYCADSRVLAAGALSVLIPRKVKKTVEYPKFEGASVVEVMREILKSPEAPIVHNAVSEALQCIGC